MKNLKTIALIAATFLVVVSCKKKEEIAGVASDNIQAVTNIDAEKVRDQNIAEAKSHPLTTLALSENNFDFGDVKQGNQVEHSYTVTNTGDKPLIISTVQPGCGCTVPEFTSEPIMPGKAGVITLKFDSTNFEGLQQKYAEVYTNTEKSPVILNFTANVINK